MTIYARLEGSIVVEIIQPAVWPDDMPQVGGQEISISQRFTAEFITTLVDITDVSPQPAYGWTTTDDGKTFSSPTS